MLLKEQKQQGKGTGLMDRLRHVTRKRILLIENSPESRQKLVSQLEERYDVIEVEDGYSGLALLQKENHEIALVIINVRIPSCDGYEFLSLLRKEQFLRSIPVITLSNRINSLEESKLLELGASDYIGNNIKKNVLLSRVQSLIRLKEMAGTINFLEKDGLTELITRQAFFHYTRQLLDSDLTTDYSIILTDIDRFTLVNAVYGERTANVLLHSMASKLERYVKEGFCGRYGADRFIILVKTEVVTLEWLTQLLKLLEANAISQDLIVRCGVYNKIDRSLSMVGMCDRALFALKSIKPGFEKRIAFYDGPIGQRFLREQGYVIRFFEAIRNEEFVVWYQPKFDPYQNRMVGAEALVRWKNGNGGFHMPGEFLKTFESNGMIRHLDEYVFEKVCQQQGRFLSAGIPLIPISINLSRNSMHQSSIAERYSSIAAKYGVDPQYLPIEITESAATDSVKIQATAEKMAQMGFPIHMDDFGSERSSLYTLNIFGFDAVKLDKGLVDFIGDKMGDIILTFMIALSKTLGIKIVAEGVETREQLDFLIENGCDQIQGYFFSKPISGEEFEQKVLNREFVEQPELHTKKSFYTLSLANHIEKMITQRMMPLIPGGFLIYEDTEEARIISSNKYIWQLFGCADEADFMDHVDSSFNGFVCPEDLERAQKSIQAQVTQDANSTNHVEYCIADKNGRRVSVVNYTHLERTKNVNLCYVFIYRKD